MNLFEKLIRLDSAGRARLLVRAPSYIHDTNFLNLLNSIDINRSETISIVCAQLRQFEAIPGMRAQIAAWIRS